jgi:competence ComEA-like helix-hairpin-helix protein
MATRAERKALLFLSVVIALGTSARVVSLYRTHTPANSMERDALDSQIQAADSARQSKFGRRKTAAGPAKRAKRAGDGALAPATRVDLDVAKEPEIEALRGIGPSLARRIVADRDSFGPFGSMAGFRRVRGVGPSMVEKLDSSVTFSLAPRPMNTVIPRRVKAPRVSVRRRTKRMEKDTLP